MQSKNRWIDSLNYSETASKNFLIILFCCFIFKNHRKRENHMAEVPQLHVNKNSKRRSSISHKDYMYKATRDYDDASSKKIEQGLSTPSFKDLMNTVEKK